MAKSTINMLLLLLVTLPSFSMAMQDVVVPVADTLTSDLFDAAANAWSLDELAHDLLKEDETDFLEEEEMNDSDDEEEEEDEEELYFKDSEEEQEYFGPKDRFWKHSQVHKTLKLGDTDYYPIMEECLLPRLSAEQWNQVHQPQNLTRVVQERFMDFEGEGPIVLVAIDNAISPLHAQALSALEACARQHIPMAYETRPLSNDSPENMALPEAEKAALGGNNPTHLNTLVNLFLPQLVKDIYTTLEMAFEAAGWQAMVARDEVLAISRAEHKQGKPQDLGIRAAEYLNYDGFSNLSEHVDGEICNIILTLVLSSSPEDYTGGEFFIRDDKDEVHDIVPPQYSALVFKGGQYAHGLRELQGKREAFSLEFWNYPDLPFGSILCAAEAYNMEEHIAKCNLIQNGDYATTPCDEEFPTESPYGVCHQGEIGRTKTTAVNDSMAEEQQE